METSTIASLILLFVGALMGYLADRLLPEHPHKRLIVAFVVLIIVGIAATIMIASCESDSAITSFSVRIQSEEGGSYISNARVTLEISEGIAPLIEYSDSNGYARFEIVDAALDKRGRLLVNAEGYELTEVNIDINQGILPEVIRLKSIKQSSPEPPTPDDPPPEEETPTEEPLAIPVAPGTPIPIPSEPFSPSMYCEYFSWSLDPAEFESKIGRERESFGSIVAFDGSREDRLLSIGSRNGTIAIYRFSSGSSSEREFVFPDRVTGLAFSPWSRFLLSVSNYPELQKWKISEANLIRLEDSTPLRSDMVDTFRPQSMSFVDPIIALGTSQGTLVILEIGGLGIRQIIPNAHAAHIWSVDFSQDAGYLVSGAADNAAYIWKINEGKIDPPESYAIITPPMGNGVISAVTTFQFDGIELFAVGTENGYFTLHSFKELIRQATEAISIGSGIWSMEATPEGDLIALGTQAGEVLIYKTKEILDFYENGEEPIPDILPIASSYGEDDPTSRISSISFSSDSFYLAIGHSMGATLLATCPEVNNQP